MTIGLSSSDTTEGTVATGSADLHRGQLERRPDGDGHRRRRRCCRTATSAYTIVTAAGHQRRPELQRPERRRRGGHQPGQRHGRDHGRADQRLTTTEAGGTATFTVVLTSQPTADVTIGLSVSDATEGTVATGSLTFTPANWNVPQTVTVTGVDDPLDDGDVAYTIVTAAAVSADANYSGRERRPTWRSPTRTTTRPASPSRRSAADDDRGRRHGHVHRRADQPADGRRDDRPVVQRHDRRHGRAGSLTFTAANWNVAQTVTVTGVDDAVERRRHRLHRSSRRRPAAPTRTTTA